MRYIEFAIPGDVPKTVTAWKVAGDHFEARLAMLRRRKFSGSVGLGFTLATDEPQRHEISATWKAIATHILPRLTEPKIELRMTASEIIRATAGPKLRLRVEGD